MAIYKNAFLTRFADPAGLKNSSFLSMYAPEIVRSILGGEGLLLEKAFWLIGIPGSGKSSILRLFCIDILSEIIKHKVPYNHLYEPLCDANVIENDRVTTVGIYVHIDELFSETANVKLEKVDNARLFYTLFDLRVAKQLLTILRNIYSRNSNRAVNDKIFAVGSDRFPPQIFSQDIDFDAFESLIRIQEQYISKVLTSFPGTPVPDGLELHNRFASLDLISIQQSVHGVKFVLMIDDVHELYPEQLKLIKEAVERRTTFPRWIASRKHIYPIQSLVGEVTGFVDGREIDVIDIDRKLSQNKALYRRFIRNLVQKRLNLTPALSDFTIEQVDKMLSPGELAISDDQLLESQVNDLEKLTKTNAFKSELVDDYLSGKKKISPQEVELLLILTHRFINKRQPSLFPELNVNLNEIQSKDKQAAELFLKKRVNFPMYTGFSNIIEASNCNVEQFLRVFSPFVDRLIYRIELDKDLEVEPIEQSKILQSAAKTFLDNIVAKLLYGKLISQLVDNLGRYFESRTYEPNAPHAPGVTQFAISSSDMDIICNKAETGKNNKVSEIIKILTLAISSNVIVPENSQHQGSKGSEKKFVFSLNRLLCIKYNLPLQRGDFQLFSLNFLWEICKKPYKPNEIKSRRLNKQLNIWE